MNIKCLISHGATFIIIIEILLDIQVNMSLILGVSIGLGDDHPHKWMDAPDRSREYNFVCKKANLGKSNFHT